MPNTYFRFKEFTINQDRSAMKVTTDACLFGAWVAEKIRGQNTPILDIGTGTGLLALMLAQKTASPIDAIELDSSACEQAKQNAAHSPWKDRIRLLPGDAKTHHFPRSYHTIISNPPFYEKELKGADAAKNIAHHDQGLLLPELLTIIKDNLHAKGRFYLLLPYKRNEEIRKLIPEHALSLRTICLVRQSIKHDHFRIMLEGELYKANMETSTGEIAIKDDTDKYTSGFTELLKDYYLYL